MAKNKKYEEEYDEEYDDEEYEDDEYEDDDEYEEEDYYEDRATFRHNRRIKNQIIVWVVFILLLTLISIGIIIGANRLIDVVSKHAAAKQTELQIEASEGTEGESETVAVEAPESSDTQ